MLNELATGQDASSAPCSFEIFELRDFAFRALPKKELVRLLTLVGDPPARSVDRQRDLMALRLAQYADSVSILVQWDSRMPNLRCHHEPSDGPDPKDD